MSEQYFRCESSRKERNVKDPSGLCSAGPVTINHNESLSNFFVLAYVRFGITS